ncbi:MAG: argininosuccinate lyase [Burkholderiales bacterium]|nr:argininosuccinate lyase [Burkholderiales bacterium]
MTTQSIPPAEVSAAPRVLDINAVFRGGGRSVEFLDEINKASLVVLCETGIIGRELGSRIARGIAQVMAEASRTQNSADYLDYEPRLIAVAGADASRLHSGRSRQDIASTIARMNLRDGLLSACAALVDLRGKLVALGAEHTRTIIPAYTHGVQAQPTTLAHYLLAFAYALARQAERMRETYARINCNPLGAAALATSSFALDRERLAQLLGFEGMVENAFDANHLAPVDAFLDVAGALAIVAVQAGQFAQDLHAQYAEPRPWFVLQPGKLTGTSSIMPQKRNPAALEQLRAQASLMLGDMQTVFLLAHNVRTGMFDYRSYDPVPCTRPLQVLKLFGEVVDGVVVDPQRALEEVNAEYSTTTEIADALLQKAEVPFRIGHHFASLLSDYGRSHRLRLSDIPFREVQGIYRDQTGHDLPLDEPNFKRIISPQYMVFGRRGLGGPQLTEVGRMLTEAATGATADRVWHEDKRRRLVDAGLELEHCFRAIAAD